MTIVIPVISIFIYFVSDIADGIWQGFKDYDLLELGHRILLIYHIDTDVDAGVGGVVFGDGDHFAVEEFAGVHQAGYDQVVFHRDPAYAGLVEVDANGVLVHFVVRLAAHCEVGCVGDLVLDLVYVLAVAGAGNVDVDDKYFPVEGNDVLSSVVVEDGHKLGV